MPLYVHVTMKDPLNFLFCN